MRLTIAILASLLFLANTAVSNATIIFTPVITNSSFGGPNILPGVPSQQTITMSLRMAGNAATDLVNQFGFRATLSAAAGPALSFVNPATPITVTQIPGFEFGLEFTHAPQALNNPLANGVVFSGTNTPGAGGPNIDLRPTSYFREREITFTINRPNNGIVNGTQGLNVTFAAAPIPGSALSGFVNNLGVAVPTTFTSVFSGNISSVPEPTSIALVALIGVVAFGSKLRSRQAKKKPVVLEV